MAFPMRSISFGTWVFFFYLSYRCREGYLGFALAQESSLSCNPGLPQQAFNHSCEADGLQTSCATLALLYANFYYLSLSDLSISLGLNPNAIAEASGFPTDRDVLLRNQPVLIPLDCSCGGGIYKATVTKISDEGESLEGIAASLEGLTTCDAIWLENPGLSTDQQLGTRVQVLVPISCACPTPDQVSEGVEILLSYPVYEGDTVSKLASAFNVSSDSIAHVNGRLGADASQPLPVNSTLLIPLTNRPNLALLQRTSMKMVNDFSSHKRRVTWRKLGIYIGLAGVVVGVGIAMVAIVWVIKLRRKKGELCGRGDLELQHLALRRPSKLKEEVEELQSRSSDHKLPYTPHKREGLNKFSVEELRRATEEFSSSNLIEGAVFYGRLNGKNLAIKRTDRETLSRLDYAVLQEFPHQPHILRLLGTCIADGSEAYLVIEYAKNGSLKDWLHGGLAMKSQFIASCNCFLSWSQRLKICLDVAMGVQFMHHNLSPGYIHGNIKSRKILLDEEFNAKIANFGMPNCSNDEPGDDPQLLSMPFGRGYLPPEHLENEKLTTSIDIFAYGVVLLEVLSGQTPMVRLNKLGETVQLSERIKFILDSNEDEQMRNFIDPALGEAYSFDVAMSLAKIAGACVAQDPSLRPTAEELVQKLAILVEVVPGEEPIAIGESSSKSQFEVALINTDVVAGCTRQVCDW